ncbi:Protein of unknown function [Thermobacillus xylanilyticus]|uniref:Uncharacterized protein n=1 Tax=Thermobacillus xylanilyticus TaxID=76633 RepID=A0ABM8V387_THEXY|nr:Protein of unknown function [Thermobacillus xylanilyticus]
MKKFSKICKIYCCTVYCISGHQVRRGSTRN